MDNVEAQMALLDPPADFQPDAHAALLRVKGAYRKPGSRRMMWLAAAASFAICAVVGQRLWTLTTLKSVSVVRFDIEKAWSEIESFRAKPVTDPLSVEQVRSVEEASRKAGFSVRLPRANTFSHPPALSVWNGTTYSLTLNAADIRKALLRHQIAGEQVPDNWDGKTIYARVGPLAIAEWQDHSLTQWSALNIASPAEVDFRVLARMALRVAGMTPAEASRYSENLSWLFGISHDEVVEIREVALRHGTGMLLIDFNEKNEKERAALIWNTPDRVFALSGPVNEPFLIAIANAVD